MEISAFYSKLMDYALWLLSRRSYPEKALTDKLIARAPKLGKDVSESDQQKVIQLILERLKDLAYLDDLRYCERFVEERSKLKPRGRYGLRQELLRKGISKKTLDLFWESEAGQEFDELPLARRLLKKRAPRAKNREQLYRFLASRGFSVSVIREALDKNPPPY